MLLVGGSTISDYDLARPPAQNYQSVWQQYYAPRGAVNLGFSGDSAANVLWRIQHGELDGFHPKAVVVLIGGPAAYAEGQTAPQVAAGIRAVVDEIASRLPRARILLLGVLPSGASDAQARRDQDVNSRLEAMFSGNYRVLYLDVGAIFYLHDGLNPALFCEEPLQNKPLQPNSIGQRRLAEAIEPALANLVGDTSRLSSPSQDELVLQGTTAP